MLNCMLYLAAIGAGFGSRWIAIALDPLLVANLLLASIFWQLNIVFPTVFGVANWFVLGPRLIFFRPRFILSGGDAFSRARRNMAALGACSRV